MVIFSVYKTFDLLLSKTISGYIYEIKILVCSSIILKFDIKIIVQFYKQKTNNESSWRKYYKLT